MNPLDLSSPTNTMSPINMLNPATDPMGIYRSTEAASGVYGYSDSNALASFMVTVFATIIVIGCLCFIAYLISEEYKKEGNVE